MTQDAEQQRRLLEEALRSALSRGESIVVGYTKPGSPTTKRRLTPVSLGARVLRATDAPLAPAKTFRLDRLTLSSEDAPLPWHRRAPTPGPRKREAIDPVRHFSDWAFPIGPHFYPAFDISLTAQRGKLLWTGPVRTKYSFHEGDTFRTPDDLWCIQVQRVTPKGLRLDIHRRDTAAGPLVLHERLTALPSRLATLLRHGVEPTSGVGVLFDSGPDAGETTSSAIDSAE